MSNNRKKQLSPLSESEQLLCNNIKSFTSKLPSPTLALYIRTSDLCQEWIKEKYMALLLGELLEARFMGGGGNPAKQALRDGYIDKLGYELLMANASLHASEFTLFQSAWEEISESFKHFKDTPKSEVELFFDTLKHHYDNRFLSKVNGHTSSIKDFEAKCKLLRDIIMRHQNDHSWTGQLNDRDLAQIDKVIGKKHNSKQQLLPTWGDFAFKVCEDVATNDSAVFRALKQYYSELLYVASLNVNACQDERTPNATHRVFTEKWESGNLYLRFSSGYKALSEIETTIILPIPPKLKEVLCQSV